MIDQNANGFVDLADAIRFVGVGLDTLYTDENVYVLSLGGAHLEMTDFTNVASGASATSYLESKTYEPNNAYNNSTPAGESPWVADTLLAIKGVGPADKTIVLNLDHYVSGGGASSLDVQLAGGIDLAGPEDDHHVQVMVNGSLVADDIFDGFVSPSCLDSYL